jgi:hypothetical protein
MTVLREATGGAALIGFAPEESSPDQNVGHWKPDVTPLAAPVAAPVTTEHTNPTTSRTGAGLNDVTFAGTYTKPTKRQVIVVTLASTGTPDKVNVSVNGVQTMTNVNLTGSAQTVTGGNGATFTATATTGHTAGNTWTWVYEAELLTGSYEYVRCKVRRMGDLGFMTEASPISTPLVVTGKAIDVTVADWAGADVIADFRRLNGGAWALSKLLWDSSVSSYVDTCSDAKVDVDLTPPAFNQTGVNGGCLFANVQSMKAVEAIYKVLETQQITGKAISSESIAGPVDLAWELDDVAALSYLPLFTASMYAQPTKQGVKNGALVDDGNPVDEPTKKLTYPILGAGLWGPGTAFSFMAYVFRGSAKPIFLLQSMCTGYNIKIAKGAISKMTAKILSASFGKVGLPVASLGAGSTYDTVPVIHGMRTDDGADDENLSIKRTTNPAAGTGNIQTAIGDGPYGDTTAVPYDTTSKKQKQGPLSYSDKVYLNGGGQPLGLSGRPVAVIFAGDHTTDRTDSAFVAPPAILIPGTGTTPGSPDGEFTGVDPTKMRAPGGFTAAHASIRIGDAIAIINDIEIDDAGPKEVHMPQGMEAFVGRDIRRNGDYGLTIKFNRDLVDEQFLKIMARHESLALVVTLDMGPIRVSPGVLSTFRRKREYTIPFARVKGAKGDVTGKGVIPEAIEIMAEKEAWSVVDTTDSDFNFSV